MRAGEAARRAGRSRAAARRSSGPSTSCRWCRRPGSTGIARCGEPSRSTRALDARRATARAGSPASGPASSCLVTRASHRCWRSSSCVQAASRRRVPRMSGMTTEISPPDTTVPAAGAGRTREATLDGLEEKLGRPLGGRGHLRLRPCRRPGRAPRPDLVDRHSPADGQRLAARRSRLQLHPHRLRRPLPADARPARLLPDGLGRQRPAHRAPGAELLRRALRPVAALRPVVHAAGEARQGPDRRSRGATSSSCACS